MQVEHNKSLKTYNTFGIDVLAEYFVAVHSIDELIQILRQSYADDLFIIGGGSNMLLTKDIKDTVLHIDLQGKRIVTETDAHVDIEVMAGENWHQLVLWTLERDYGGLENLSLIPGNVGTSPIQNIGAYGVELKDTFVSCEAINIQTLEVKTFSNADCSFGYRNSIFKHEQKGNYIITSVRFRLTKKDHVLKTSYGVIEAELSKMGITRPTIQDVSQAVIAIRSSKLPNPKVLGNSGSFFKNPIIDLSKYEKLKQHFPEMPSYPVNDSEVKVPAGWLIDKSGLKGFRDGDAGVHKNQALVLVNYGDASGQDILKLSKKVQDIVFENYGIALEAEVNIF